LLPVDEHVRQLVHHDNAEEAILHTVRSHVRSIRDDGLRRVQDGLTTLEEVLRVTQED
jgi:general secretion pathway protein E